MLMFFQSPDRNFEIAILFSIVEKPINYVFQEDLIPCSQRGGGDANCKLLPLFNGYSEVYRHFQGNFFTLRGGGMWEDLSLEEFTMSEENFYEGAAGFSSII